MTPAGVRRYVERTVRGDAGGGPAGLSARAVPICHTVLRQALEQARRWRLIARNAALDATPPVPRRREIVSPTVEQVQALLEAAEAEDADFAA